MKSMNEHPNAKCTSFSDAFYGTSTVGERGQVVIPAEARAEIGFHAGDKVVIMRHPVHSGLMIFKLEAMREFLDEFTAGLNKIQEQVEGTE
jgi:AbrB family looped-hinge helix DNA binding protein